MGTIITLSKAITNDDITPDFSFVFYFCFFFVQFFHFLYRDFFLLITLPIISYNFSQFLNMLNNIPYNSLLLIGCVLRNLIIVIGL